DRKSCIPRRAHDIIYRCSRIRYRDHGHELWKISITGAANEQTVRNAAGFSGPSTQPRARTIAVSESFQFLTCGLTHHTLFPAVAYNPDFIQIPARSALLNPQATGASHCCPVHKCFPVDVSDVASFAGAHEANRNNTVSFPVILSEFSAIKAVEMYEAPPSNSALHRHRVLNDEPFGKSPADDVGMNTLRYIASGRRSSQHQGVSSENETHFCSQSFLVDRRDVAGIVIPMI